MSIKLVVFDMAGTTVKDGNYVGAAFTKAMQLYGYQTRVEDVSPIMGYQKPVAIRMMLEKLERDVDAITPTLIDRIHTAFVEEMLIFYRESKDITPLAGVEDTFKILREEGVFIGLDTGFSRDIAQLIVDRLDWNDKIDILVASDEVEAGRPYPYMIEKMMRQFGITDASEVAKVGDTEVDINEGHRAQCKYIIGVTTGAVTRDELATYGPTHIVDHIEEVLSIVR